MLFLSSLFATRPVAPSRDAAWDYLAERMTKPQRHRLLHGYPLAAAMRSETAYCPAEDVTFSPPGVRGLLVGVLPHPFCNPTVEGCGFCTFSHESYNASRAIDVVDHVVREVEARLVRQPDLRGRPVAALYFGGGTANLTPAAPFRRLCRALASAFDLHDAEITLEGVPIYFLKQSGLLLDVMREELPARHFRLSMGVQTFDEARLRTMGRQAFGNETTFRQVVELGHKRRCTVSADLLFNLPGQSLEEMCYDVARAVETGFDHLGLYHLVLFRGLGTAWSRDPALVAALPDNETAATNWVRLREQLLASGFGQTTLTNFERTSFQDNPRRFVYEEFSFRPDRYEVLGFGPGAISFTADGGFTSGLKVINPDSAAAYVEAVRDSGPAWDRWFFYQQADLKVLYLTRRLAALCIERGEYAGLFGSDPQIDFPKEFNALAEARLITGTAELRPTPRGMFYSDAAAALLTWEQVRQRRSLPHDNGHGHM